MTLSFSCNLQGRVYTRVSRCQLGFKAVAQLSFGKLLAERRRAKHLTQEDVAGVLGMTRANYGLIEGGKRKEVIDPDRAIKLARLLDIDMFQLVAAMGYPLRIPGSLTEYEAQLLENYRRLSPAQQQVIRAAVLPG